MWIDKWVVRSSFVNSCARGALLLLFAACVGYTVSCVFKYQDLRERYERLVNLKDIRDGEDLAEALCKDSESEIDCLRQQNLYLHTLGSEILGNEHNCEQTLHYWADQDRECRGRLLHVTNGILSRECMFYFKELLEETDGSAMEELLTCADYDIENYGTLGEARESRLMAIEKLGQSFYAELDQCHRVFKHCKCNEAEMDKVTEEGD